MPVPTPNLDDRRWADLVDEGRSLIPAYSTEWTDFNPSDPGITLMELLAAVAEMDIYHLNRVSDRHKRKFLELLDVAPAPPSPAHLGLAFTPQGSNQAFIPAATEFSVSQLTFRTLLDVTAGPAILAAIQTNDVVKFHATASFPTEPLAAFGVPPLTGAAVYFGLTAPLPPAKVSSFLFHFDGPSLSPGAGPHHSAIVAWEYLDGFGNWSALQVDDSTRSFSADGHVRITGPASMTQKLLGRVVTPLYYVRVRYSSGQFDTPPRVLAAAWNAVEAEQAATIVQDWVVAPDTVAAGPAPLPGQTTSVVFGFNQNDQINSLIFAAPGQPQFRILNYVAAAGSAAGLLSIELVLVARGTGGPSQQIALTGGPAVIESSVALFSFENGGWRTWDLRPNFDASRPADSHFALDAQAAMVRFGDGQNGRALPEDALLFATYLKTAAASAPISPGQDAALLDNEHNASLLGGVNLAGELDHIVTVLPAAAGADVESLGSAIARAARQREAPLRAISLADYEALALSTPGTSIARVAAHANLFAALDSYKALGIITVIVVPNMPVPMPRPSAGLLSAVRTYLNQRRVIGTRVDVVGPTYLQVGIEATVQSVQRQDQATVRQAVTDALNLFLDPLRGGPDGTGWPFGRDIYEAEILSTIARTPGVDHVISMALVPAGCEPHCGNICLRPGWLATPGLFQIEVL